MTSKISDLSKEINKFIRKEKFNYVKRDRKITLNDSLLHPLENLFTQFKTSI